MPYGIKKVGSSFKVVNKDSGRVLGSHPTKAAATSQLRAVYVNTKGK